MLRRGRENHEELVRHDEELRIGSEIRSIGEVDAHKLVDTVRVEDLVDREIEHAEIETAPGMEGDSGKIETLPDGSISIPVFEERLVVTKQLVVRERVVVRKHTHVEQHRVEADLRSERVEVTGAVEEPAAGLARDLDTTDRGEERL